MNDNMNVNHVNYVQIETKSDKFDSWSHVSLFETNKEKLSFRLYRIDCMGKDWNSNYQSKI